MGRGRRRKVLTNPVTIVLPIVVLLFVSWHFYTEGARGLSVPVNTNLLPTGSFDDFGSNGLPKGWTISTDGSFSYAVNRTKGYDAGSALLLQTSQYVSGDLMLASPVIPIASSRTYLFKGYYAASHTFELLVRKYYQGGSSQLQLVRSYPGTSPGVWTTVSDAFVATPRLAGVQYLYHITSNESLKLDGTYFEQDKRVYTLAPLEPARNLIPNSTLSVGGGEPASWLKYSSGKNKANFAYIKNAGNAFVRVSTADYKDGEAKWQYRAQKVGPYQRYRFSVDYMSDTHVSVIAEYVLKNGKHQFETLITLTPMSQWATVTQTFDTSQDVASMFVAVVLQSNGTLSTDNYRLFNITKPGATHWRHPLISLAFDDGWESAYTNAVPILARFGYKGTFYINPTTIQTSRFMTGTQLQSLDNDGDEIASEGFNHLDMTTLGTTTLDYQLQKGQNYLAQAGLNTRDFAAPYGKIDAEVSWYARKYYHIVRGTEDGINTAQNFNPYNLKVLYIGEHTSLQTVQRAIQLAKANDGWLIIVYHQIGSTAAQTNDTTERKGPNISTEDFLSQIQAVANSGIKVVTVDQAYQQIQSQ